MVIIEKALKVKVEIEFEDEIEGIEHHVLGV